MTKTSRCRLSHILIILASIIAFIALILAIWKIPQLQVTPLQQQINILKNSSAQTINPQDVAKLEKLRIDAENTARTVIVQGTGGFFVFLTALISFLNYRETQRNVTVAEEKQITERFSKAIEQLGSQETYARIGAMYAFERISRDSEKDYWQVMEILTAYVRAKSPSLKIEGASIVSIDVEVVLTILSRRTKSYKQGEEYCLDLSRSYLCQANFSYANFNGANFSYANFNGADLNGANFSHANLIRANLSGADLFGANLNHANLSDIRLNDANLSNADLSNTKLMSANIESAELKEANLMDANLFCATLSQAKLENANLENTNFCGANLENANFCGANLENANLEDANLENANLINAKNLTLGQVKSSKNWEKAKYNPEFYKQLWMPETNTTSKDNP